MNLDNIEPFSFKYLIETKQILSILEYDKIEKLAQALSNIAKNNGRLFIIGVGGSAATASHAVNDFRKICNIEAYAPTDNVAELTAITNDEGWQWTFCHWLRRSHISKNDALLVFSVGGGDYKKNISTNIINAIDLAIAHNTKVFGIVGKGDGYTARYSDICIIIPPLYEERITFHTEGISGIILHLLVSHPVLQVNKTKWEISK